MPIRPPWARNMDPAFLDTRILEIREGERKKQTGEAEASPVWLSGNYPMVSGPELRR